MKNIIIDEGRMYFESKGKKYLLSQLVGGDFIVEQVNGGLLVTTVRADNIKKHLKNI